MIKINLESAEIPVQIGDFSFIVSLDDDSLVKIDEAVDKVKKEITETSDFDLIRDSVSMAFDVVLGDGAFGDIYEKTPSTAILASILIDVVDGLKEEFYKKVRTKNVQPDSGYRKKHRDKR